MNTKLDFNIPLPIGCGCVNTDIGSYQNQVELETPEHMKAIGKIGCLEIRDTTCVDKCVAKEVQALWRQGVVTTGCCCGHNSKPGYIGIIAENYHHAAKIYASTCDRYQRAQVESINNERMRNLANPITNDEE